MDPEIKELLAKNLLLAEENNKILRNLRTSNRIAIVWKVFYIAFFVGSALLAFNFLRPYFEQVQATYEAINETRNQVQEGFGGFFGGDKN